MKIEIPKFETNDEKLKYLSDNEQELIYQAKSTVKYADSFEFNLPILKDGDKSNKAQSTDGNEIKVRAVINTTNIMDSHKDVHIDGLWKKSLSENKRIKHLQEHQMKFDKIISDGDELKAFTKTYNWKDLGYDVEGKTQALVFDSTIKRERNSYMFDQYSKGRVDNHSVGMRYVSMKLAINSEDEYYEKNKTIWDKYINNIVNKDEVEKNGYFWAVLEAKAIEGSAVPVGSNQITPTLQPSKDTVVETKEIAAVEALSPYINFLNK